MSNKRKTRMTPFYNAADGKNPANKKYYMKAIDFCEIYGLDIAILMRRLNTLFWDDFDAFVIPQNLRDAPAHDIRKALQKLDNGRPYDKIDKELFPVKYYPKDLFPNGVAILIDQMDDYMKDVFRNMDNYFFLNPKKIDLDKVFTPVKEKEADEHV